MIIQADDTRMIDLPGVGPCPRPVDIDQRQTGFKRLKSLRIYRFVPGPPIHGESEGDEVFIVPLQGVFDMTIIGVHPFHGRISAGRALYMTPHHAYTLAPVGPVVVAYARAEAQGLVPAQPVGRESLGLAEHLRMRFVGLAAGQVLQIGGGEVLVHVVAGAVDHAGVRLVAGQTLALDTDGSVQASTPAEVLIVSA